MALQRKIGFMQATAINMIDMVGIGPFIVMASVIESMNGSWCMVAWILGAVISLADAAIWSELGAAFPQAGGTYAFLRKTFGSVGEATMSSDKIGRWMSFLFIWQTVFQAPLVGASAAIGFSTYAQYLFAKTVWFAQWKTTICIQFPFVTLSYADVLQKSIACLAVVFVTILLYRKIESIGKLSVIMWSVVVGTMLWLIGSGIFAFDPNLAFQFQPLGSAAMTTEIFFAGLGMAMGKTVYSYLGYYNVCHLGSEIISPESIIPKSMYTSIIGIALLYCTMQMVILGVVPVSEAIHSQFVASVFFEKIYGRDIAQVATILILLIALSSLFAVMLGYSRVPYAAALDGQFFAIFGKEHPTKFFPVVSLLVLGGFACLFSLLFKLTDVINAILTMRIVVQFIGQAVGLALYRKYVTSELPWKMWMYPVPMVIAVILWVWLFSVRGTQPIIMGLSMMVLGSIVWFFREYYRTFTQIFFR